MGAHDYFTYRPTFLNCQKIISRRGHREKAQITHKKRLGMVFKPRRISGERSRILQAGWEFRGDNAGFCGNDREFHGKGSEHRGKGLGFYRNGSEFSRKHLGFHGNTPELCGSHAGFRGNNPEFYECSSRDTFGQLVFSLLISARFYELGKH
jgi:hypothetical protein